MPKMTINQTFDTAIAAEKATERLFRGLQAKFAHYEEVAKFWEQYAVDETHHAKWLEDTRSKLSAEQLAAPANDRVAGMLRIVSRFSVDAALKEVRNLEDAYQLVHEVESAETNAIFDFLLDNFAADTKTLSFLRSQLRTHVSKLTDDFPAQFQGTAARLGAEARN